ncbi:LOW QUALITY PROTEIN: hypothetical protein BC936DRAFT_137589 [Jimgerdemannia flammicorona]|uniref:Uncharacterized protein n=2 Tax=Jimgerdemannia flammicorona TaxID=994334 RepID=A0A433CX12_9FUNG|nr:LOW QUALITY PROTEIN: hypothetical protein BC936DRAFT_137589 [Jimgerdemannia flammicorona]RUS26655.1 LOW QUALITY PROTEIN: hypothetical protein BC938DRAFT_484299 [Jimgerdemannia flammicorona]
MPYLPDAIDEPLFGGATPQDKLIEYVVSTVVLTFVALTMVFALVNGFGKSVTHMFIGFTILGFTLCLIQLMDVQPSSTDIQPSALSHGERASYFRHSSSTMISGTFQLRWWRLGDLEPKFKYYILAHAFSLTMLCCVAQVYFWTETNCPHCQGVPPGIDAGMMTA